MKSTKSTSSADKSATLLSTLATRFEKNMNRHKGLMWADIEARLKSHRARDEKLRSLLEMERTGGEPDVIGFDKKTGEYLFCDCSAETPAGRRSLCYDPEALESRKANKPANSVVALAADMGIKLLSEEQYF